MVRELKLRRVGNSVGLILPKEALQHLNVGEGDIVCLTDAADGAVRLTAVQPEVVKQLEVAKGIMRRYRHALRELAK